MSNYRKNFNKLVKIARTLREDDDPAPASFNTNAVNTNAASNIIKGAVQDAAQTLKQDPTLGNLGGTVRTYGEQLRSKADERLERLIKEKHARKGEAVPTPVDNVLQERKQERDRLRAQTQARQDFLAKAANTPQHKVLQLVALSTPWMGGNLAELRYTSMLDQLAPKGDAASEMSIHRALWTLAEQQILSVSSQGVIVAVLPETDNTENTEQPVLRILGNG